MKTLLDHLAAGRIRPLIYDRLPLAEAARAHELLESRQVIGKLLLKPAGAAARRSDREPRGGASAKSGMTSRAKRRRLSRPRMPPPEPPPLIST